MKIRLGFVSNSSSSSFLIYGVNIKGVHSDDVYEMLLDMKTDAEVHEPDYSYGTYIGVSWDKVKDDETGRQFKNRVEAQVNQLLDALGYKDERKFGSHDYAWFNG